MRPFEIKTFETTADVIGVGTLLFIAAIIAAGLAAVATRHSVYFQRSGIRTDGRIVSWEKRADAFRPTVEFQQVDGTLHRFRSGTQWPWRVWRLGFRVPVIYDPQNPRRMGIDRPFDHWHAPLASALIAILLAAAGLRVAIF